MHALLWTKLLFLDIYWTVTDESGVLILFEVSQYFHLTGFEPLLYCLM